MSPQKKKILIQGPFWRWKSVDVNLSCKSHYNENMKYKFDRRRTYNFLEPSLSLTYTFCAVAWFTRDDDEGHVYHLTTI